MWVDEKQRYHGDAEAERAEMTDGVQDPEQIARCRPPVDLGTRVRRKLPRAFAESLAAFVRNSRRSDEDRLEEAIGTGSKTWNFCMTGHTSDALALDGRRPRSMIRSECWFGVRHRWDP